ncbi:GntR family transcriptional regulator [Brevibacterium album]|uniref:GntR family transcriptional regulator n=1 Tax=Brevibacterium album TaxID=417948 RepID=UPI0006863F85|nr:GntR family transcriptional regulator [Brevibacterium album]
MSAAERAYRTIRDGILEGTHAPGTMLGEATLAAELGVSRTPVRTALARLADEGWIVVYPKRGVLVTGMSAEAVAELADARFVLESTAVERAPEPLRLRLAERLAASVEAQREAFARGDVRAFIGLTLEFHHGFVEAGGNAVLLELYERLADRHRFVLFAAGARLLARCEEIIAEHEALVALLRAGETAGFAQALRAHIAEVAPADALGPARLAERDVIVEWPHD